MKPLIRKNVELRNQDSSLPLVGVLQNPMGARW
jgi:hypothetical protein